MHTRTHFGNKWNFNLMAFSFCVFELNCLFKSNSKSRSKKCYESYYNIYVLEIEKLPQLEQSAAHKWEHKPIKVETKHYGKKIIKHWIQIRFSFRWVCSLTPGAEKIQPTLSFLGPELQNFTSLDGCSLLTDSLWCELVQNNNRHQ